MCLTRVWKFDRGFKPQSGQTKYYKIGMCCLSAQHTALRRKSRLVGTQHSHVQSILCIFGIQHNHVLFVLSNFGTEHNHRGFKSWSGQTKDYKNGICCFSSIKSGSIDEKEQRLVGSESGECVQVGWHVYPPTVVSVS